MYMQTSEEIHTINIDRYSDYSSVYDTHDLYFLNLTETFSLDHRRLFLFIWCPVKLRTYVSPVL
jgi:hypothetical protein